MERYASSQGSYHLVNRWSQNENILTINNQLESWIMNPESSLHVTKTCLLHRDSWVHSICLLFLLPIQFPGVAQWNIMYSFISPLATLLCSVWEVLWGQEKNPQSRQRLEKGQSFSGGGHDPSHLLCVALHMFPNAALPHFLTEIASSPPCWMTTTRICAVGLVLPTWG